MIESKERTKAADLAISQIERQFGKGAIMKLGDRVGQDIPVISSTSMSVDYALGVAFSSTPEANTSSYQTKPTSGWTNDNPSDDGEAPWVSQTS